MNRFFLTLSVILLSTLSVGLFAPSSVSASTPYDDLSTVDSLELVSANGSHTRTDMQLSYIGEIKNCSPSAYDSFTDAIASPQGGWFINQWSSSGSGSEKYLTFTWSSDPRNSTIVWEDNYGVKTLRVAYWGNVQFSSLTMILQNNNEIYCYYQTPSGENAIWYQYGDSLTFWGRPFLAYNVPITYPSGYEGEIIRDSFQPPDTTPTEFQFTYSVADKEITLYDISNLSLDQTDCYFQINPNGTQVYTELHFDCNTKQSVTHTVDDYGSYDIVLIYVTPDGLNSSKTTTIDIDGSTFSGHYGLAPNHTFYQCIYSELPFIDFNECYNNILIFTNLLFFDRLEFGTDLTPHDGCRDLIVLGGWISASTNRVCPMFPSYVRDVTTPFITFLLGLLMIKFITSRGGGGFS